MGKVKKWFGGSSSKGQERAMREQADALKEQNKLMAEERERQRSQREAEFAAKKQDAANQAQLIKDENAINSHQAPKRNNLDTSKTSDNLEIDWIDGDEEEII